MALIRELPPLIRLNMLVCLVINNKLNKSPSLNSTDLSQINFVFRGSLSTLIVSPCLPARGLSLRISICNLA